MADNRSPARPDFDPFRVEVRPERDAVRVVPVGELDVDTAGELEAQLDELLDAGFDTVVLDLRELDFIGSTGIRAILLGSERARDAGCDFSIISGSPAVQRVFDVCGLLEQLRFRPS
jgi:anti-sigma B factor antagonist